MTVHRAWIVSTLSKQLASVQAGVAAGEKPVVVDGNKCVDTLCVTSLKLGASGSGVAITATAAEINSACDDSARFLTALKAQTLDATHNKKIVKLNTAGGSTVTLPAATGGGVRFKFAVAKLIAGNTHTIKTTGNDVFVGLVFGVRVDEGESSAALGFAAGGPRGGRSRRSSR